MKMKLKMKNLDLAAMGGWAKTARDHMTEARHTVALMDRIVPSRDNNPLMPFFRTSQFKIKKTRGRIVGTKEIINILDDIHLRVSNSRTRFQKLHVKSYAICQPVGWPKSEPP